VRLLVPQESVTAAQAVLERQQNGHYAEALELEQGLAPAVCVRCGSRSMRPVISPWWVALLVLSFGLATIFPPPRKGVRCSTCRSIQP